jgi:serine protease Do
MRPLWKTLAPLALFLTAALALSSRAAADELKLPPALSKPVPETVDDLKQIQAHVKTILTRVMPAVVNLKIGAAQGSGIIISEDGYVLTAGHVSGEPDRKAVVTFPDGKEVEGKTLGWNRGVDSGLVKITTPGKYQFCEMGKSGELKKGDWCIAIGHPAGFQKNRTPPVRLGRTTATNPSLIRTDCVLVGGDSGGPLFDMYGRVIGIHSRIEPAITGNVHVPVDTYRDTWEYLVKGDKWSGPPSPVATLGVRVKEGAKDCDIEKVDADSAAAKAGVMKDDVITGINGKKIESLRELQFEIRQRKPGEMVTLDVRRGDATLQLKATLGKSRE